MSYLFIEVLASFLCRNSNLSHLNMDGMNLNKDLITKIGKAAAGNDLLMGVHFSDNDIVNQKEL